MTWSLASVLRPGWVFAVSALGAYAACGAPSASVAAQTPLVSAVPTLPVKAEPMFKTQGERSTPTAQQVVTAVRGCAQDMARLEGASGPFCIDRFEASLIDRQGKIWPGNYPIDGQEQNFTAVSRRGRMPQGYISGEQAEQVCENAGKRLCQREQWVQACRGPTNTLYPYGNVRTKGVCNDRFKALDHHPVARLFWQEAERGTDPKSMWSSKWMNDPRLHEMSFSVVPTGEFEGCTNEYGVYDMVGNLHEWVADPGGTFVGGFFMDTYQNGEGCDYKTFAHAFDYHDYSTGFRCCSSAD